MANNITKGITVNEIEPIPTRNTTLPDLNNKTSKDITLAVFGMNPATIKEVSNITNVYSSRHGMFASVPIICRVDNCAYKDVCMVSPANRVLGQRCPMEIAAILSRYEQWCAHFDIDTSQDKISPLDLVDATLIKDLVNIEIQMLRAENKIALNGDFMSQTLLDIDRKCTPYYGKVVSPEVEFLMSLHDKKIKILNQLNATRKDKASDKSQRAASDMAIRIFQQVQNMERNQNSTIIDVNDIEFDDQGEVIETLPESTVLGGESNGNGE